MDNGFEFVHQLPTPFVLEVTGGITNGRDPGHSHNERGPRPQIPLHYLRVASFLTTAPASGVQFAVNGMGHKDDNGRRLAVSGIDFIWRHRHGRMTRWLLQGEGYFRQLSSLDTVSREKQYGGYLYGEKGWTSQWATGLRLDALTSRHPLAKPQDYAVLANITYRNSEFSLLRLTYQYNYQRLYAEANSDHHTIEVQFVAILGSHPAHQF